MAPEALATLFGLAVAVYALLPAERRLDLRLRLHRGDLFVLAAAILLVHYILFFPVLAAIGIAPHLGPWRYGFTPATASYLTLLGAALFVTPRAFRSTLTGSKVPQFRKLLERLLYQRRYADLIFLLDRHLHTLSRAYKDDQHESRDAAKDALRRLLLTDDFVRELAKIQPDLGLRILEQELVEGEDFQALWLAALLDDTTSSLYYEVTNAVTSGDLDDGSRILHFYLDDVQRARTLLFHKAVGDYVIAALDRRHRPETTDRYNQPYSYAGFDDGPRIADPVYAALIICELMVSAAIDQRFPWPRPLDYFIPFTDRITRNLSPDPRVDLTREWPTPYHFFLDRMVFWLCEWIKGATGQLNDEANPPLRLDDLRYGNGDIPRNAVLVLGNVTKTIMTAKDTKVGEPLKVRVLEAILGLQGDPYGNAPLHPLVDLVLESIVVGGDDDRSTSENVAALRHIKGQVDSVLRGTSAFAQLEQILARY